LINHFEDIGMISNQQKLMANEGKIDG